MYSTNMYLYNQNRRVTLVDPDLELSSIYRTRNHTVYSHPLKAHKGTDTTLLFQFLNQNQHPVNLHNHTFTFRVISQEGDEVLLSKDLTISNAVKGKAKITLLDADIATVQSQTAYYTIERDFNGLYEPTFVDDNANARGNLEILDSVYPSFIPSMLVTLPDLNSNANPPVVSSQIKSKNQTVHTLQIDLSNFIGAIQVQGSAIGGTNSLEWYDLTPDGSPVTSFSVAETSNKYYNINGTHPYLRIKVEGTPTDISPIEGNVVSIFYR